MVIFNEVELEINIKSLIREFLLKILFHRQQKLTTGSEGQLYGEYASTGDTIGVGLDMEAKILQFWLNGKDLGVAFSGVAPGKLFS